MELALVILVYSPSFSIAEPFDRVFVFAGGSHQTATFLGMTEYAIENGWKPDCIVSTCGSSLANQIINQSNDPKQWRKIIESREFYNNLKKEKINSDLAKGFAALKLIGSQAWTTFHRESHKRPEAEFIQDVFSPGLLEIPTKDLPPEMLKPFSSNGIRSVIIAAKLNYGPEHVGKRRRNRKLLTEIFFTDDHTGRHLKGFLSPIAKQFPNSTVAKNTEVTTNQSLGVAARASISEPLLMNIMYIEQGGKITYFLAGSVDSYPIEVGKHLGKQVIATRIGYISDLETMAGENFHGFNMNDRRTKAQSIEINHWIDRTETAAVDQLEPGKVFNWDRRLLHLESGIPDSYEEYQKIVRYQWEWGRKRMREALDSRPNSLAHVRNDSGSIRKDGLFYKAGQVSRFVWAPLVSASTLISELRESWDEEENPGTGVLETAQSQGDALLAYLAVSALMEWGRSHVDRAQTGQQGDQAVQRPRWKFAFTLGHLTGTRNLGSGFRISRFLVSKGPETCREAFVKLMGKERRD